MYKIAKYKETDSMSDLINDNFSILLVMSRFGISLGFGDQTVDQVCKNNNVDTNTFLAIINITQSYNEEVPEISTKDLILYLRNSHSYFLDYRLPSIRRKLIEAIDFSDTELVISILHYYDEYVEEVRRHMAYEEDLVFPYVKQLIQGEIKDNYNIDIFSSKHDKIGSKLTELKNIIIKYYSSKSSNELNNVLFDIFLCEKDLSSHNEIEDKLLIPNIRKIEKTKK